MKLLGMVALTAVACATEPGVAAYPERPVRMVVASAPGGGTDFVGRLTGKKVSEALGQPFVIDNRGGAAGILGSEIVARAEPDGYTILVVFSNFATYPSLGKKLAFDVRKDLEPVSILATTPLVLVVNNGVPATTVRDLIDFAKRKRLNYAAPGVGSMGHLAAELFNIAADARMTHVAYKGGGPAIIALIGNEVDVYFSTPPAALSQVRAGRLRALAVTSANRVKFAPELPTVSEAGLPGYDVDGWFGLFTPARTRHAVASRLHAAFVRAVNASGVEEQFARQGLTPQSSGAEALATMRDRDIEKWANVIRQANIRID